MLELIMFGSELETNELERQFVELVTESNDQKVFEQSRISNLNGLFLINVNYNLELK